VRRRVGVECDRVRTCLKQDVESVEVESGFSYGGTSRMPSCLSGGYRLDRRMRPRASWSWESILSVGCVGSLACCSVEKEV
jgi:hypothetical protein